MMWIFRLAWDWLAFFALYVFIMAMIDDHLWAVETTTENARYLILAASFSATLKMWWTERRTSDAN